VESLANRVRDAPATTVSGVWQRHVAARRAASALQGRRAVSRWGTEAGFPVLHLGRPRDSVVVEAYRHLVDPLADEADIAQQLLPRVLVTCEVHVSEVLDLRTATARLATGLDLISLQSETRDRAAYRRCQEVAAVAHQLGMHGVVAPAATRVGETLAIFPERLPVAERPVRISDEAWLQLPADPRRTGGPVLRLVRGSE